MKQRLSFLLSLLFLTCLSAQAQSYNVTVQGTLYDLATGLPAANHPVRIEYDSTQTFFHQVTVNTNAAGFYSDVVSVPYPSGNILVRSIDCGGVYRVLSTYVCSSTNSFFNGQDTICQPNPANCQAQFGYSLGANRLVNFTWQSGSGSPWVGFSNKTWDFGDGSPVSHAFSPSHTYAANGTYVVCLSILTGAGCTSTYCDTIIVGGGGGNCHAAWSSASQGGGTYAFSNTSTAAAGVQSYLWNFGDGATSTAANPTHTYASAGTYTVTLQLVALDGCTDTRASTVTYQAGCQTFMQPYTLGNPLNWYFSSNISVPPGTWITAILWDFGDGSTANYSQFQAHNYATTGTYPVCLTVTTNVGCVSSYCDSVVIGNGGTCVASFRSYNSSSCSFSFGDSSYAAAGISSRQWDFGDGSTSTAANPSHAYATSGAYWVCLTIVGNDSCTSTFCDSVYCGLPPSCNANFTTQVGPSGSQSATFLNASTGGGLSYFWQFGDGTTSSLANPSHTWSTPGTYNVCLTVSGSGCTDTQCYTVVIPGCHAAWTASYLGGGTYAFSNSSSTTAGVLSYYWTFGDGGSSTAANPTHTYAAPGSYAVNLVLVALDSCMDSHSDTLVHALGCQASFSAHSGGNPLNWTFYGNPTLPSGSYVTSWNWSFGDGSSASGAYFAQHSYASTGTFPVCLTIQTNTGCSSTICDTLVIGSGTCVAAFGYQQLANCNFVFHDSSFAVAGIASYQWDFGDGGSSTAANPSHTFTTNGFHQVCLTIVAQDSCTSTHCDSIYCGSAPPCQAAYTWVHDTSGQYTILLYNQSVGGNLSYLWDFGDGATSTQQYPDHVYAGAGYYVVCLTVSDGFGCSSTFCDTLDVLYRLGVPFSINVVSPTVGVVQPRPAALAFALFPNPAAQLVGLHITTANAGAAHVRVLDAQGRTAHMQDLGALAAGTQQQALDLGHLPAGIYFVELSIEGQRQVQKLALTRP
jgi:PKD repeat protein